MPSKLELDPRLDPRIKAFFAGMPLGAPQPDVASREELLAQELSTEGAAICARQVPRFDAMDSEDVAPSTGLTVRTETFTSRPTATRSRSSTFVVKAQKSFRASTTSTAAAWHSALATKATTRPGAA
jgi:hypothetical protein